jgi:hypothetical protein
LQDIAHLSDRELKGLIRNLRHSITNLTSLKK